MKRLFVLLTLLLIIRLTFAVEPKYMHWSGTIDVGTNFFEGDIKDTHTSLMDKLTHPSLGVSVDYTILPFINFGFAYNYHFIQADNGTDFFNSNMKNFYPYLGVNILNLVCKKNPANFGFWAHVGFGLAKYNFVNQTLPEFYTQPNFTNVQTYYISGASDGLFSRIVPYGFTIEYKMSNQISFDLQINRCNYSKDNLEGIVPYNWYGATNDNVNTAMLQVRYKFCKKGNKHIRDCTWNEVF